MRFEVNPPAHLRGSGLTETEVSSYPRSMSIAVGMALCAVGIGLLLATFRLAWKHPEWDFRSSPARWMGALAILILGMGALTLLRG